MPDEQLLSRLHYHLIRGLVEECARQAAAFSAAVPLYGVKAREVRIRPELLAIPFEAGAPVLEVEHEAGKFKPSSRRTRF